MDKQFAENERVLVLIPDDSRKLYARWLGPATVKKRMGDRSYLIEFESGKTNVYHVNQLRQFKERVDYVNSVVIEADIAANDEDRMLPGIDDDDGSQTDESGQLIFQMERSLTDDQRSRLQTSSLGSIQRCVSSLAWANRSSDS